MKNDVMQNPLTQNELTTSRDVVVIGAGQAGLAVAWHLAARGVDFTVLDGASAVGQSWRSRWDSLRLFTAGRYNDLPGMAFPGRPDRHPTKDEVADYLGDYVRAFNLPVELETPVRRVTAQGGEYAVHTDRGVITARQVVVATGAFQVPFTPAVAAGFAADVVQQHSAEYRNPAGLCCAPACTDECAPGQVLVVGAGNSGLQIALELAGSRRVAVAVGSKPRHVPQRLLGKDLFWWLTRLGAVTMPADSRIGARMRARGELVVGTSPRALRAAGVELRPRLVGARGNAAAFADGSELKVSAVVWATGYRSDHSWIEVPGVLDDGGRVVHRRGVTAARGLYFIGLPWQHSRGSALLGFVKHDAEFIAAAVAENVSRAAAKLGAGRAA